MTDIPKADSENTGNKILDWVTLRFGNLESLLNSKKVPSMYHKAIKEGLDLRSKYGPWFKQGEEQGFQEEAIRIYRRHNVSPNFMGPIHTIVLDITRLWRNELDQNN